jgi:outer membrane protein assembly factor BamB
VRWRREVGVGFHPQHPQDIASQSPTCDGEVVVFAFGTGDIAAFDHDGAPRWKRNLQKDHGRFTNQWVYGSSPLLHQGRLYLQVLQTNPDAVAPTPQTGSYILCIDPATGRDVWKHPRPTTARGESQDSYASPIPLHVAGADGGRDEILIFGGDCLTGHDAVTGNELWRFGGWNPTHNSTWRMIPTPVVAGGNIVICTARGNRLVAVHTGGAGDIGATHQAWDSTDISTDIAVPLQYRGRLYVLHGDRKILACLDPATGAKQWEGPIDSATVLRGSPTAGDGKIYCVNESGDVWVLASDGFRVLSRAALGSEGGETRSSIALAHGQVFVRTADRLHAFGGR